MQLQYSHVYLANFKFKQLFVTNFSSMVIYTLLYVLGFLLVSIQALSHLHENKRKEKSLLHVDNVPYMHMYMRVHNIWKCKLATVYVGQAKSTTNEFYW